MSHIIHIPYHGGAGGREGGGGRAWVACSYSVVPVPHRSYLGACLLNRAEPSGIGMDDKPGLICELSGKRTEEKNRGESHVSALVDLPCIQQTGVDDFL